jgi:hypothetical protein
MEGIDRRNDRSEQKWQQRRRNQRANQIESLTLDKAALGP